jgi:hypothetical protein
MLALASPRTSIEQGEEGVPVSTEAKFASMSGRPLPPSPYPPRGYSLDPLKPSRINYKRVATQKYLIGW